MDLKETVIELHRNDMKFSVAHFTIFSESKRERVHGHNFYLSVRCKTFIKPGGVSFDYRELRRFLLEKCHLLNERFLLAKDSPYLRIELLPEKESVRITFNKKEMILLEEDILLLPLENISSESLSYWFLDNLLGEKEFLKNNAISMIEVKVSTTTGQSSSSKWVKNA